MNLLEAKEERMNMERVQVRFAKLREGAIIPSKRDEDAGCDVYANFKEDYIIIPPHSTTMIATGIASSCDEGYYFQLLERGSTGTKGIGQRCGVIDSGYRGEWFVPITNHNNEALIIVKNHVDKELFRKGVIIYPYEKAICQFALLPVPKVKIQEVSIDELNSVKSERGEGALGSSGK